MIKPVEGRGVQSVEVGARLLNAMVEIGRPAMLRDLAAYAQVTSAQAHAYFVSFRKTGLVEQDPATGRYLLGPFALQLGLSRMRQADPLRIAGEAAADLASELGLMVTVAVWGTHGPTIVQVQEASGPIHVNLRAGVVYTVTGTATGRLFAAFLPDTIVRPAVEAEIRAGAQGRAIGSPTTLRDLAASSRAVRRLGYATTEGLPVPGINAVAAPVFDHTGQMPFCLTVIGTKSRLDVGPESALAPRILSFCRAISQKLGFTEAVPSGTAAPAPGPAGAAAATLRGPRARRRVSA